MEITVNNLKLIQYQWYTARTCVGIVLCKDTVTNEYKSYIGGADGQSEKADLINIMSWGAKFPVDVAKTLMKNVI